MSATQVKVFELRKELGYSNAEVAKQLNLSEQTVKNQLSLALKAQNKLAEHLSLFFICFKFEFTKYPCLYEGDLTKFIGTNCIFSKTCYTT